MHPGQAAQLLAGAKTKAKQNKTKVACAAEVGRQSDQKQGLHSEVSPGFTSGCATTNCMPSQSLCALTCQMGLTGPAHQRGTHGIKCLVSSECSARPLSTL